MSRAYRAYSVQGRSAQSLNASWGKLPFSTRLAVIVGSLRANLKWADLSDAKLTGADLRGANLKHAKGLTKEQIEEAIWDQSTKFPRYLQRPESWSKNLNEQAGED